MMSDERRRYFRIDDMIGISYKIVSGGSEASDESPALGMLDLVSEQDERLKALLGEVQGENPKVAELVTLINQKLECIVSQLILENKLMNKIAYKIKEANISACGIAFINDEGIAPNTRLALDLTFYPDETTIATQGRVVGCDAVENTKGQYYWRIDFVGMTKIAQEDLIQLIVRKQSAQLKSMRK